MLLPEKLRDELRRQPFVPLRIHLTDGKIYDIRHPEMAMVTSREVYIGREETSAGSGVARECDLVSLLHVVRVEQMPYSATAS
ncbi:MAG: hypothetical protein ABSG67_17385 [Thermoguttaceae bacterium]|jgi:hypothetical protein